VVSASKKERPHFGSTNHPANFSQYKERYQSDRRDCAAGCDLPYSICAELGNGIRYRLAVPHSDQHVLYDVKADECDAEQKRFLQNRINERLVIQPVAKMQVLGNEHDLRKNQGINDSNAMCRVTQLMLRQNH
jgi:hypothetical protein